MSTGSHGFIINLSSKTPFVFTYNPTEVEKSKKINYFEAPNLGGASRELFFTGFSNKETTINLVSIDKENPLGVIPQRDFFEQLSEPDAGLFGVAGSFFGNENFPPPQVLFGFGLSIVPLVCNVRDVSTRETHFVYSDVRGAIGVPIRIEITLTLSVDERSTVFKANQVARKASAAAGALLSVSRDVIASQRGTRRESPGMLKPRKKAGPALLSGVRQ